MEIDFGTHGERPEELILKEHRMGCSVYTIRFGIEADEDVEGMYKWHELTLPPARLDYATIVDAIISFYYSSDKMQAVINNCLQNLLDTEALTEYVKLQECRNEAKRTANELIRYANEHNLTEAEVSADPSDERFNPDGLKMLIQGVTLLKTQASELPDERAKDVPALFPTWASRIGEMLNVGERLFFADRLYKVLQSHVAQETWSPDVAVSLFTEVGADVEQGTIDNPIPYNGNMELEQGKYYTQNGATYLCIRSTGIPVYNALSDLIGLYVELINT